VTAGLTPDPAPDATRRFTLDPAPVPVMTVRGLTTVFRSAHGTVRAVDDVSIDLRAGEILGIVGESGSGKSMFTRSVIRLLPVGAETTAGEVVYDGQDLLAIPQSRMHRIRGREIASIFQDPIAALNPVYTVGRQLAEAITSHNSRSRVETRELAVRALADVGIPSPARRLGDFPHQFSGGMAQRVVVAIALASDPRILLADEPTTALDVTTQHQILMLLLRIQRERQMTVLLVSHSLGVIAQLSDRVAVMYAGQILELADTRTLLSSPRHPYTVGLLGCVPDAAETRPRRLVSIPGSAPDLSRLPDGCRFAPRCPLAIDACTSGEVPLIQVGPSHEARCIRTDEVARRDTLFSTAVERDD